MLAILKLVRSIFRQMKSELTPGQLAVGAFLGALAGLTPFGAHLALLFAAALLANCSMAAFLLVAGALKPLGLALGGASFSLGASLLQGGGLTASLIEGLAHAPVLAYLGFDRYVVAGGYAVALPVALALGVAVRLGVAAYRTKLAPRLADAAWYGNAMKKWHFRFFRWAIAGKEKELQEPKKRFLLLRPFRAYMVVAVPLLAAALTVGGGLWAQAAIGGLAAGAVSRALGVKCTFGKIEYSFFGQRLAFENFQLPDPSNPREDMVRIGGFEADLGFLSLLSKRLHIEKLALRDVAAHAARTEDGKLNVTQLPAAAPDPAAPAGEKAAWQDFLSWVTEKSRQTDWSEVWTKYQEYRAKKKEAQEKEARGETPGEKPVLAYDPDLRWEPRRRDPLVRVDLVEIKNLAFRVSDRSGAGGGLPPLTEVEATGADLSMMPGWNGRPLAIAGAGKLAGGKSGAIAFKLALLPPKTEAEITLADLPLADCRALYEKTLPVAVTAGRATLAARGGIDSGRIDLPVNLRIDQLQVAPKPGQAKILGLDEQTSGYAIQGINAYGAKLPIVVGAAVTGPAGDPSLQARVPFLEIAKKGLEMLGKQELQKAIDRLGGEIQSAVAERLVPLEGDFKNVQDQTIRAIRTGDTQGVQEAIRKAQADVKSLPDAKKDLEQKKDQLKDALDLFKKKK